MLMMTFMELPLGTDEGFYVHWWIHTELNFLVPGNKLAEKNGRVRVSAESPQGLH